MADTGWLVPTTATVVTDGDTSWSNTGNVFASDNSHTTSSISKSDKSHTLRVSGFGAAIPDGASNIRLEVSIERKSSGSLTVDYRVQWFNGTARAGDNKASSSNWPTSDAIATYGSSSDTWNAGITLAQANSSSAGIDLAVSNNYTSSSRTVYVDQIRIRFHYNAVYDIGVDVQAGVDVAAEAEMIVTGAADYALSSVCSATCTGVSVATVPVSASVNVFVTAELVSNDPAIATVAINCTAAVFAALVQIYPASAGLLVACNCAAVANAVREAISSIAAISDFVVDAEQVLNNRVKYTLSHPVFGSRMYEVVVRVVQSSLNLIDRFWFAAADNAGLAADVEGIVTGDEIGVTLPHGTNLRALEPMIDVSIEATVVPASGVVRDFSAPVVYEVTAETGVSRVFTVRASVTEAVGKSIVRFNVLRALNPLLPVDLVADVTESAVTLVSPNVADVVLGALKPTVQISEGASVVPASTQERDFRGTVPYRVTAGDGSSVVYSADMYRRVDVGSPSVAGQVSVSGGVFTMLGSGTDIWGSSDKFFFVFRSMTGDCWAEVLLESQQATNDWAKAGLMVRSTLLGNSVHAFVGMAPLLDGSNRTLFVSHRLTTGGTSVMPFQGGVEGPPVWLRLEKVETEIRAYRKTVAGSSWTLVQSVTVPLIGSTAYVGFAVCSKTTGLGECVFRGLRMG